jgi:hypothetical protein
MTRSIPISLLAFTLCCIAIAMPGKAPAQAAPPKQPQRSERLLATTTYSAGGSTRLLSLWKVPLAISPGEAFRTGPDGKTVSGPLNTAYVLIDGSLDNPFSGNLVWALKSFQSPGPAESMTVDAGSIAWHSVQKRAYVVLSRSAPVWARIQVFQVDVSASMGTYSPLTFAKDNAVLAAAKSEAAPFAEWKNDSIDSIGVEHVDIVQTLLEPESLLVHLLDESGLQRIKVPKNETRVSSYKGEANLRLNLKSGTWTKVTE